MRDAPDQITYFDIEQAPPVDRLVDQALRNVDAGRAAHAVLRDIDAGTARPDELAERLLALLIGTDDAHRADVIKGFMRPISKRIEAKATTAPRASGAV